MKEHKTLSMSDQLQYVLQKSLLYFCSLNFELINLFQQLDRTHVRHFVLATVVRDKEQTFTFLSEPQTLFKKGYVQKPLVSAFYLKKQN